LNRYHITALTQQHFNQKRTEQNKDKEKDKLLAVNEKGNVISDHRKLQIL